MPPPPPQTRISMEALTARVSNMFWGEGQCPQRSDCGGSWSSSPLKLIVAAAAAVNDLWGACEDEVRAACAPQPIRKQEILGYLLADLLGHPLLHAEDAMLVGQRGENALVKAKGIVKVKSVATCWARVLGGTTALDANYDLQVPAVRVDRKRSAEQDTVRQQRQAAARAKTAVATVVTIDSYRSWAARGVVQPVWYHCSKI